MEVGLYSDSRHPLDSRHRYDGEVILELGCNFKMYSIMFDFTTILGYCYMLKTKKAILDSRLRPGAQPVNLLILSLRKN